MPHARHRHALRGGQGQQRALGQQVVVVALAVIGTEEQPPVRERDHEGQVVAVGAQRLHADRRRAQRVGAGGAHGRREVGLVVLVPEVGGALGLHARRAVALPLVR